MSVEGCPVLIDCCFPHRAFSSREGEVFFEVDTSSHSHMECKVSGPKDRFPIVAYNTDPELDLDGKVGALFLLPNASICCLSPQFH